MNFPYQWQPSTVSVQLAIVGDVVLAAVPGEFTTMSGRRLREELRETILSNGGSVEKVVIAGLSNVYSDYIVTPEEYQVSFWNLSRKYTRYRANIQEIAQIHKKP